MTHLSSQQALLLEYCKLSVYRSVWTSTGVIFSQRITMNSAVGQPLIDALISQLLS